jgi:hypothetical protein
VQPFLGLKQSALDQTLAEIKHKPDCRLRLSQQNHGEYVQARKSRLGTTAIETFQTDKYQNGFLKTGHSTIKH